MRVEADSRLLIEGETLDAAQAAAVLRVGGRASGGHLLAAVLFQEVALCATLACQRNSTVFLAVWNARGELTFAIFPQNVAVVALAALLRVKWVNIQAIFNFGNQHTFSLFSLIPTQARQAFSRGRQRHRTGWGVGHALASRVHVITTHASRALSILPS